MSPDEMSQSEHAKGRQSAPHWALIAESTCVAGIRFLYAVHRLSGRRLFQCLVYPVVFYYWCTRPIARDASMQYLRLMQAAHGGVCAPGRRPDWRHGLRHFRSFAESILDKLMAAGGGSENDALQFVGHEAVLAMLRRRQGGLFITSHVGCLEVMQAGAGRRVDLKLTVLVHTAHAERFNRLLESLGYGGRVRLLQVTEVTAATAVLLAEKVANGEFIAIAADRVAVGGGRIVQAALLGRIAAFPAGPYVLAMLLACPVFVLICLREAGGYVVRFERLAERVELPRGHGPASRSEALGRYAAQFARVLEAAIARTPYQWFNFYPFWLANGVAE